MEPLRASRYAGHILSAKKWAKLYGIFSVSNPRLEAESNGSWKSVQLRPNLIRNAIPEGFGFGSRGEIPEIWNLKVGNEISWNRP